MTHKKQVTCPISRRLVSGCIFLFKSLNSSKHQPPRVWLILKHSSLIVWGDSVKRFNAKMEWCRGEGRSTGSLTPFLQVHLFMFCFAVLVLIYAPVLRVFSRASHAKRIERGACWCLSYLFLAAIKSPLMIIKFKCLSCSVFNHETLSSFIPRAHAPYHIYQSFFHGLTN